MPAVKSKRLLELQALAEEWARRLGMAEWTTINVLWANKKEQKEVTGCCYWHVPESLVTIKIDRAEPKKEETLVHELLHVLLEGHLSEARPYDELYERALNRASAALVRLKYEGRREE